MVVVGSSGDGTQIRILARGNFSLSAAGLVLLLLVLGVVTLGLAGFLAYMGYWPVLLVAIVQLVLVACIFVRVWKDAWIFEEICIDAETISVVRQRNRKRTRVFLESAWATIRLEQPGISWYAAKLILRSKDQQVELGAFLTDEEKVSMAKHLSRALSEHTAWRPR